MATEIITVRDLRCSGCGKKLARIKLISGEIEIVCPKCKMKATATR